MLIIIIADRLVRVRELPWANKYMPQSSLIKLTGHIENLHRVTELKLGHSSILGDSSMPLSELHTLTVPTRACLIARYGNMVYSPES